MGESPEGPRGVSQGVDGGWNLWLHPSPLCPPTPASWISPARGQLCVLHLKERLSRGQANG